MTSYQRNVAAGGAVLAALLLALIIPDFHRGALSLAHPDPVGPTVYSKSAIGHLAFEHLLDEFGIPTRISESGSGGYVAPDEVLVIAEPRTDDATLADIRAMLTGHTVLLVLPKRTGVPDPKRPYWLTGDKLLPDDAVTSVLHLVDPKATVNRDADLLGLSGDLPAGTISIEKPQLIRSKLLRPLLAAADGILVGERRTRTGRIVVLADPDLIANHGLARGDNSIVAVGLIERLRSSHDDGVVFDEFIHGFSPKPFHLLGILFQFPFLLVTAQIAVAILLLVWAATGRFGASEPLAPPIEAGKRSLIDTGACLLAQSGRIPDLSDRYFEQVVRDTARRLRAPHGLDLPALIAWVSQAPGAPPAPFGPTAPQHIWTWRKELLGESRPHTKLD